MQIYDLVFVGSGLSSSAALYHVLTGLQEKANPSEVKNIAVIEKNNEFWKGIPYGNRSSIQSLTINPIKDFFQDDEKPLFFSWLNKVKVSQWPGITAAEKDILDNWIAKNEDKFNDTDIDGLYIPRFLYGVYLAQKLEKIVAECKAKNIANVDLIYGEAIDATKADGQYQYTIDIENSGQKTTIAAKVLALATGSLDPRSIINGVPHQHLCIDDIYQPSLATNLKKLTDTLALIEPAKRNIMVIGSNASASEIVHMLCKNSKAADGFNKVLILSNSGSLPERLYVNTDYDHMLENLKDLEAKGNFTADELMAAIQQDVKNAAESKFTVGELHYSLSDRVVKMQKALNAGEALNFFNKHGWSFTRITRRTSEDYYFTEKELAEAGKLHFVKGRFIKLCDEQNNSEGLTFIYKDPNDGAEKVFESAFPVIINCGGAEHISATSSKLLKNLIAKDICKINHNSMGIAVDEDFAANDNLYIMGPLLAGIYNSKMKFWHLENAKRLNGLAAMLSDTILSKI